MACGLMGQQQMQQSEQNLLQSVLSVTLRGDLRPFALIFKPQMGGFGTFFMNVSHCIEFESFSDKAIDSN